MVQSLVIKKKKCLILIEDKKQLTPKYINSLKKYYHLEQHLVSIASPELLHDVITSKVYDLILVMGDNSNYTSTIVSSKTTSPIICFIDTKKDNAFCSFISNINTPNRFPILSVPLNTNLFKNDFLIKNYDSIKITGDLKNNTAKTCVETLEKYDIEFNEKTTLIINFFDMKKSFPKQNALNVPIIKNRNIKDYGSLFNKSKKYAILSLNNGENVAIFVTSIINRLVLANLREELELKFEKEDN